MIFKNLRIIFKIILKFVLKLFSGETSNLRKNYKKNMYNKIISFHGLKISTPLSSLKKEDISFILFFLNKFRSL